MAARALDAGDGQAIPTLAEVLDLARGRVRVNVDIKETDIVAATVQAVRDAGDAGGRRPSSRSSPRCGRSSSSSRPRAPASTSSTPPPRSRASRWGDAVSQSVAAGVGVPYELVNEGMVDHMHRHGFAVFAWTVDDAGRDAAA